MKYTKIEITGEIELESGLHIDTSDAFAAIGAIDSPVIKDSLSGLPIIPGSSIKGKMRTLLAKAKNETPAKNPNDDCSELCQLFGSSEKGNVARLAFRDCIMSDEEHKRLKDMGAKTITEAKFENTIDRISAVANPRQIERVIRGAKFPFTLVYSFGGEVNDKEDEISADDVKRDFKTIVQGLKLLGNDYLGGSGTRGYGNISFRNIKAECVFGELENDLNNTINSELQKV